MAQFRIDIKRTLIMYVIALVIISLSSIIGYYLGSLVMGQSMLNELSNEIETAASSPIYIFTHNLEIATLMFIPFIGPVAFAGSLSFTGFFLGDLVFFELRSPLGLLIGILVTLFLPHGIIEIMAYAFAVTGSLNLTLNIIRARITRNAIITYIIYYVITVVLLFIAANVEYWELTTIKGLISSI